MSDKIKFRHWWSSEHVYNYDSLEDYISLRFFVAARCGDESRGIEFLNCQKFDQEFMLTEAKKILTKFHKESE